MSSRKNVHSTLYSKASDAFRMTKASSADILSFSSAKKKRVQKEIQQHFDTHPDFNFHLQNASEIFPRDSNFLREIIDQVFLSISESMQDSDREKRSRTLRLPSLKCLHCHSKSNAAQGQCETFLSSTIQQVPATIGSYFPIDSSQVSPDYYLHILPITQSEIHFVEGWWCPSCANTNWLEVVVEDNIIQSMWTIKLHPELFQRIHFLSTEIIEGIGAFLEKPPWSIAHDEALEVLRKYEIV